MSIHEVSKLAGVSVRTLHHLLPPDRGNNGGGGYPAGASGTSRVL